MQYEQLSFPGDICPEGWHIPSDYEWLVLETYIGIKSVDETGIRGEDVKHKILPGGITGFNAKLDTGYSRIFLSSTLTIKDAIDVVADRQYYVYRAISDNSTGISRDFYPYDYRRPLLGCVRCIRDEPQYNIPEVYINKVSLRPSTLSASDAPSDTIEIRNFGSGILHYSMSADVDWLDCSPSTSVITSGKGQVIVNYNTAGMLPGIYYGTLSVIAPAAITSRSNVFIKLTITDKEYGKLYDDRDNQTYRTIRIGNQTWMADNLNIGTKITRTSTDTRTNGFIEKFVLNHVEANSDTFGGLYTFDEIMQADTGECAQGICPNGWHIPSHDEYQTMIDYIGGVHQFEKVIEHGESGFDMQSIGYWEYSEGMIFQPFTYYRTSTRYNHYTARVVYYSPYLGFTPANDDNGYCLRCIRN